MKLVTSSGRSQSPIAFLINVWLEAGVFFFYMNIVHTNKYNKKLQSPGALNIKETPGYKQKENVKKIMITKNKSKPKN